MPSRNYVKRRKIYVTCRGNFKINLALLIFKEIKHENEKIITRLNTKHWLIYNILQQ